MSQSMNSFLQTYIETIKKYIVAWRENRHDELHFLKDDIDYFWDRLDSVERESANEAVREFNRQLDKDTKTQIDLDEIE